MIKKEYDFVTALSDDQIVSAVVAMANTVGQRVPEFKKKKAYEYKAVLVKEWEGRNPGKRMFK